MFYQPTKTDHNLPFDPFKACVVPRPIGWISTVSPTVTSTTPSTQTTSGSNSKGSSEPTANLAPYSQFQNLTFDPPYVMFSANQTPENTRKDSVVNAESTGIFCWQLATYPLREAVNITSEQVPYGVDEFERAGLERTYSTTLKPTVHIPGFKGVPMVKDSPVRFECEYHTTIRLPGNPPMGSVDIVIGKVVGVHISDEVINLETGKVDVAKTEPIARCGYYDYAVVRECFEMKMPGAEIMRSGLEGSAKKNREANPVRNSESEGVARQITDTDTSAIADDKENEPNWSGKGAPSHDSNGYDDATVARLGKERSWSGSGAPSNFDSVYKVKEVETRLMTEEPTWNGNDIPVYESSPPTNLKKGRTWSGSGAPNWDSVPTAA